MDFLQVIIAIATAGAIYGGIRADLRHMHEEIRRAHERIDSLMARL